ncbi:MAG: hypothetical protein LAT54_10165 [Cryomorphaceae bacterium]|nr:hypothetical protein [Cryomorphaceae bacterium]
MKAVHFIGLKTYTQNGKKLVSIGVLLLVFFAFSPYSAVAQSGDGDLFEPKWNFGLGAGIGGYSSISPSEDRMHFMRYNVRANIGYFMSKRSEIGVISQFRAQQTNISEEENAVGFGGGYYYRYNITQFDPLKSIFKDKFKSKSFFFVEWEHQLTNYDYIKDFPNREVLNIFNTGEFANHQFLPKVGWKMALKNNFFINAQVFYQIVNGHLVDHPLRLQLTLDYTF